jgi:DNA (cytosine-5)-methyltransferase 1
MMRALDLVSVAAGGWSIGLHRAGFVAVAACEIVEWRRILYMEITRQSTSRSTNV